MTATTYRVDFTHDDTPDKIQVYVDLDRPTAMAMARVHSKKPGVGMAYAIATRDGRDTGQRVYANGRYSHTDDQF